MCLKQCLCSKVHGVIVNLCHARSYYNSGFTISCMDHSIIFHQQHYSSSYFSYCTLCTLQTQIHKEGNVPQDENGRALASQIAGTRLMLDRRVLFSNIDGSNAILNCSTPDCVLYHRLIM